MTYAAIAVFLSAAVATIAGVASWGFHPSYVLGLRRLGPRRPAARVRCQRLYLIPLFARRQHRRAAVHRHPQQRRGRGRHGRPRDPAVHRRADTGLEGIQPYLLTEQFQAWQGLLRTPTDWAPIAHSAWVCALTRVPALFAAYLVLLRRDVAGG